MCSTMEQAPALAGAGPWVREEPPTSICQEAGPALASSAWRLNRGHTAIRPTRRARLALATRVSSPTEAGRGWPVHAPSVVPGYGVAPATRRGAKPVGPQARWRNVPCDFFPLSKINVQIEAIFLPGIIEREVMAEHAERKTFRAAGRYAPRRLQNRNWGNPRSR